VGAHPHRADAVRGKVELAEVFARHGAGYCETHALVPAQHRAVRAIEACRSERLGGHLAQCDACGELRYHYHSCRNRHCPKCQTLAKERWLAARRAELLPVRYFHLVFTLPHKLNALAQGNPREIYALLFEAVSATLLEFGANRRWLGGEIAASLILHTWGQTLTEHLHLHGLIAAGALGPEGRWIHPKRGFLFPVKALSPVFRAKFLAGLRRALDSGALAFQGSTVELAQRVPRSRFLADLRAKPWVVYAKRPLGGPEQVLDYLGRYTHRVAIANNRLLSLDDAQVRFRYKDYAHGNRHKVMCLAAPEFIRRFLLHILPTGFMRIRHYGLLANRAKAEKLAAARAALNAPVPTMNTKPESLEAFYLRTTGRDIHQCPRCTIGRMIVIAPIQPTRSSPTPRAQSP